MVMRSRTQIEVIKDILQRSHYDPITECMIWGGSTNNGYGMFKWEGTRYYVHRFIYSQYIGPIIWGVFHTCDNSRCWSPHHLFTGEHSDNMLDMKLKGRAASGENHGRAILTVEQVMLVKQSHDTIANLAFQFNVGETTIRHILAGQNWSKI